MKLYVKSNADDNILFEIPVVIEVVVPDNVYSSSDIPDRDMYDEEDQLILSVYECVIDDMETMCRKELGMETLYYEESESKNPETGEPSNSRYLDFCFKDHEDAGTVRVVFMLRVTDHKLTNKRRDGSDRRANMQRRKEERLADYENRGLSRNLPDRHMYPFSREIKVGPKTCRTQTQAIDKLLDYLSQYRDEIIRRENADAKQQSDNAVND